MGGNFIIEAWTELAIAILAIVLRLYFGITQRGWRALTLDDYLMVLAGAFYLVETTAAHFVVAVYLGMANNNVSPDLRASLDTASQEWRHAVNGSKTHIIGWFMYTGLFWTLKCCWTLYYTRMTDGLYKMDTRIKIAWILNATTYVAAWQIDPDPGNNCYPGASKLQISFVMAINTVTDIYLMAIPLPIIYRAHLDLKRKISLIILFSGGWIVIIFGILRCATLVSVGPTQPSESGQWSVRESFLAVVISNGPMIFPLFKRWAYAATGIVSSNRQSDKAATYPLDSQNQLTTSKQTVASSGLRSSKKKSRGFQHPLSIPNDTAWGSDEAIVTIRDDGTTAVGQDKISGGSLDTVCETSVVGFTRGGGRKNSPEPGLGEIVMTREWDIRETHESRCPNPSDARMGYMEPAGWRG
ncbi:hypothetical protein E8E13_009128 [Curvularia kusanoi]|uniref:Rhodopsin domain-containing protein n=1 Tax=Curvularia kusanoi TaxID=90978 RepID=A0A9P4TFK4_CURKU|nr:hypothetical protein E8E13_009128 [Curvularia kusanoi]